MMYFDTLKHNTVYKLKINSRQAVNSIKDRRLLILNSIEDKNNVLKELGNESRFANMYKNYKLFYTDFRYHLRVISKNFNENLQEERRGLYEYVSKSYRLRPISDFRQMRGFGMIDTVFVNKLFKEGISGHRYNIKVDAFVKHMQLLVNQHKYQTFDKDMVISIDEWMRNECIFSETPMGFILYILKKMPEQLSRIGNINIIFIGSLGAIRINPLECADGEYMRLRTNLVKIHPNMNDHVTLTNGELDIEQEIIRDKEIGNSVDKFMSSIGKGLTGDRQLKNIVEEKIKKEATKIAQTMEKNGTPIDKLDSDVILDYLEDDKDLNRELLGIITKKQSNSSVASSKRDELLREKQETLEFEGMTVAEMRRRMKNVKPNITSLDVTDKVKTLNKNVTKIRFNNFDKEYNKKLLKADILNNFLNLNNYTIPCTVKSVDIKDTSDVLTLKDTWKVELEDNRRVRHNITFDIPKFLPDGHRMYVGGNKKMINYQMTNKPVVKTSPNEVQVCSASYNKVFIERRGENFSEEVEKIKRFIANGPDRTKVVIGDTSLDNKGKLSFIEYDELGKSFVSIKRGGVEIIFSQVIVEERLAEKYPKYKKKYSESIIVGFDLKGPIEIDLSKEHDMTDDFVPDILFKELFNGIDMSSEIKDIKVGKKFTISYATIMGKRVPLIFILMYLEGMDTVMKKAGIDFEFTETRPRVDDTKEGYLEFADGYLKYSKAGTANNFLMNAFYNIQTKGYNYNDFNGTEPYLDIFEKTHGQRGVGLAFLNYYNSMICPLTKETLEVYHYPVKFVELMLFANEMLSDNSYSHETKMECFCKIRSNEVIPALVHKELATAYGKYLASANNNNPKKISIPRDAIMKKLMSLTTVEDVSTLNPIYEVDKLRTVTAKGHIGMNLDESYTIDKRAMDISQLGIIGISSPTDANVGKVKTLTMEPEIYNTRGYFNIKGRTEKGRDELKDANLFTLGEMLTPVGAQKDDATRTAMSAAKQSKHIVPVKSSSPVMISNGAEMVLPYHLTDDFAIIAEGDGQVVEYNEDTKIMVVKYFAEETQEWKYRAIDLGGRMTKNGGGGFWLEFKYQTKFKVGDKFKKNDILATDDKFFKDDLFGHRFTLGSRQYVAIMSSDATFEDSTEISASLCRDMESEICMEETIVLGKNANLNFIVKEGQEIRVGEPLLEFEESFDSEELNKMLAFLDQDAKDEVAALGKKPIHAHYTGTIASVNVYSVSELDELSPSLRKFVNREYNKTKAIHKQLDKYQNTDEDNNPVLKAGMLIDKGYEKVDTKFGVLKGSKLEDGVRIDIKIKVTRELGVGDKITFYGPLKTTVGNIVPDGMEPFTLRKPDKKITCTVAANSVNKRMVQASILSTIAANKVLVELNDALRDIYES